MVGFIHFCLTTILSYTYTGTQIPSVNFVGEQPQMIEESGGAANVCVAVENNDQDLTPLTLTTVDGTARGTCKCNAFA